MTTDTETAPAATGHAIPPKGIPHQELLARMQAMREGDADWKGGRTFSLVYSAGEEHADFLRQAYGMFISENGLNPMAFTSLKRMEHEVVRMSAHLLHGDDDTVGTLTSGGTESILLAVKTYRDMARKRWPWIRRPEMVVPDTVHVAFDKAAHLFGVRIKRVPVGKDYRADLRRMRRAIGRNTIMLACSAPQYPHGLVDPVSELAELARKKKLPLHVDSCIGGFLLPFAERLGHPIPLFDFRVPGVTSISADLHKYGYAAKGASVVLYRSMDFLKHQFFVQTDWSGGIYLSPSLPGTRPGGAIAAAWGALHALGEDGYLVLTERTMEAAAQLKAGIADIPGIAVVGAPVGSLVSYRATDKAVSIFAVADRLEKAGWHVDRQQNPDSLHCTLSAGNAASVEPYLDDLRAAVEWVRAHPEAGTSGQAAMYGMMARLPVRGLVKHGVLKIMEGMYGPSGEVPDLAEPGAGSDDPLLGLIDRYGPTLQKLLERANDWREQARSTVESLREGLAARFPWVS